MCGSPPPHQFILGSVSTFKCDDPSALKHLCTGPLHHIMLSLVQLQHSSMMTFLHLNNHVWDPFTTLCYPWFSFNIQVWWPFCTWTLMCESTLPHHFILGSVSTFKFDDFMCESPPPHPPHHFILGSVSTFKCDDLSTLEHLCMSPFHHITYPWFASTFKCDDPFALKHLCIGPLHHIMWSLVEFQHSSVMTFFALEHLCIPSTTPKNARKSIKTGKHSSRMCTAQLTMGDAILSNGAVLSREVLSLAGVCAVLSKGWCP